MRRTSFLAIGLWAGLASADAGPDFGKKYVPVRNVVCVHGGVTDTAFYTRTDRGVWKQVTFKPGEPTTLELGSRGGNLYLVPATIGKRFLLKKELTDELDKALLPGVMNLELRGRETLPVRDSRARLEERFLIRPGSEGEPPRIEKETPDAPTKKESPVASGRLFVAGVFLTAATLLWGLGVSCRMRPRTGQRSHPRRRSL